MDGSTCQYLITEGGLIRTSLQRNEGSVFTAWRKGCDFSAGNWKSKRNSRKGLELTHGCHSEWLARREGWIPTDDALELRKNGKGCQTLCDASPRAHCRRSPPCRRKTSFVAGEELRCNWSRTGWSTVAN